MGDIKKCQPQRDKMGESQIKAISSRVVHNIAFNMLEEFSFFPWEFSSFQKIESHSDSSLMKKILKYHFGNTI